MQSVDCKLVHKNVEQIEFYSESKTYYGAFRDIIGISN